MRVILLPTELISRENTFLSHYNGIFHTGLFTSRCQGFQFDWQTMTIPAWNVMNLAAVYHFVSNRNIFKNLQKIMSTKITQLETVITLTAYFVFLDNLMTVFVSF